MAKRKDPDPPKPDDDDDDENDDVDEKPDPADATLEDRVQHLETILHSFLTAHGETYTGALEHLETLAGHIREHH
jgi:hypothetical protein